MEPTPRHMVGTCSDVIKVTPTVSAASAYAANDTVGGLQTIPLAVSAQNLTGLLTSITVSDKAKQSAALTIFFFSSSVTLAADNAAFDVSDADMLNCPGVVTIAASDYSATASNSVATKGNLGIVLKGATTSLYAAVMTTGTPTYTSTSDLQFSYGIQQD